MSCIIPKTFKIWNTLYENEHTKKTPYLTTIRLIDWRKFDLVTKILFEAKFCLRNFKSNISIHRSGKDQQNLQKHDSVKKTLSDEFFYNKSLSLFVKAYADDQQGKRFAYDLVHKWIQLFSFCFKHLMRLFTTNSKFRGYPLDIVTDANYYFFAMQKQQDWQNLKSKR